MPRQRNKKRPDGRIAVQVYIGRDENGKRKYKTVYGTTQKEANEKAAQLKLQLGKGLDISASRDTFDAWGQRWLKLKQSTVEHNTYNLYFSMYKHLEPLYHMELSKIRPYDIQLLYSGIEALPTLRVVKIIASGIFELAIANRVVDYNPVRSTKLPRAPKSESRRALTPEEQRWIIDTPHEMQTAAMIMMLAGLRRGELLALTWNDVDLNARTITVDKSVTRIGNTFVIKSGGKTKNATRVVDIPRMLADYLARQPRTSLLVCPRSDGALYDPTTFSRCWERYLRALDFKYGTRIPAIHGATAPLAIQHFTPHWLRHTCATNMYHAGIDALTAKNQLGHANIQTTLDIYTHLDAIYKRRAVSKLDAYLDGTTSEENTKIK